MTHYRSTVILNEINIASNQVATILLTSPNEQKIISLEEPYDDGLIKTENLPFEYGCGNYDSTERAVNKWRQVIGCLSVVFQKASVKVYF